MTVDELSSTYTVAESLAVMQQRDVTGRRCHKTLKGRGEAVWPPTLEAALIKGLHVYSERHRVHMRHRGRFIGRNHFLSDYVKTATGRRRTAKQVGSRLQQLKDTCRELDILYLITGSRSLSPRRDPRRGKKSGSKTSSRRSVSSSPELSDGVIEQTPEPHHFFQGSSSPEYVPLIETPQVNSYSAPPVTSTSPVYVPSNQCSFTHDQCSTVQYYASSQCYSHPHEWSGAAHPPPSSTYSAHSQQWGNYYPAVEAQQQYAYYDSQYY